MSDDLDAFTVRSDHTVADVYRHVSANGTGVAVVTSPDGRVLGTVTDSSIRRSALRDPLLRTTVAEVMSKNPVVADPSVGDDAIGELLVAHRLRGLPVVDGGRLVGMRRLDEFPDRMPAPPVGVLMVGGRGERLRPLTDRVPKPLLKIGPHSIVERIILALAAAGVHEVYLAVNYLGEQFEERLGDGSQLGVQLHYLEEREPLHTAGALSLLPEIPDAPILVSNGDLVTTIDYASLFDFHWRHAGAVTIAGVEHRTYVPYGVLSTAEHHLLAIEEKPERRDFVNAGMYVLQPEVLRYVPPGKRRGMPELIDDVMADGLPVHVYPLLEGWYDIGSPEELERVMLMFATGEEE